jgi:hypothetical protein
VISEGSSSEYTSNYHNNNIVSSSPSTYVYLGGGPSSPKTVKVEKIDMKTQELKKLEGMEDISNFFGNPAPPATIAPNVG